MPGFCIRVKGIHTVPTTQRLQPSIDIGEVARLFQCNPRTVRRMIADGRLPAVQIGRQWRIRPEHVAAMLGASA
jgi:excisionase family DNA binding protein